ncbi:MAG: hypothetical protein Q4Q53_03030 [Methanocorpusculum sp.]|nr:hypothetical protein [Methanocorpusculum sp.]
MDDTAKTEMRNYTTAAGFLIIALAMLMTIFAGISNSFGEWMTSAFVIIGLVLILTGVILIVCKNRDLSAITFIMIGMLEIFLSQVGVSNYPQLIISIFMLILAAVILTAKDTKKYLLAVMPALWGIGGLLVFFTPQSPANLIILVVTALTALYFAFACASEKINFPSF